MAQNQPLWLQLVHRFERAVGRPVEDFVTSDAYFDLLTQATRAGARFRRRAESLTEEWLHLWNLPAGSDVRQVQEQLSRVERRLARLAKEVRERESEDGGGHV